MEATRGLYLCVDAWHSKGRELAMQVPRPVKLYDLSHGAAPAMSSIANSDPRN